MLATRTARWTALTVLTSLLLVVAFWFLLIGPRRAEAAEVAEQTTAILDEMRGRFEAAVEAVPALEDPQRLRCPLLRRPQRRPG